MRADAIIFDKDGTLLDFDAFWVTLTAKALEAVLKQLDRQDIPVSEILAAFGVRDGVTDIDSVLCKGTYEELGQVLQGVLEKHGCDISSQKATSLMLKAYQDNDNAGELRPTCPDLAQVLTQLKRRGKKLAVVTTDDAQIARRCLEKLGILNLFDRIYADDGKTPTKPDPYCALAFCKYAGTTIENVVMVGDTMTDVRFAKNAGMPVVGIAKTQHNADRLRPYADRVVESPAVLLDLLD